MPELANDVFVPTTTMQELEAVIAIADKAEVAFAEQECIERDRTIRQGILKKQAKR